MPDPNPHCTRPPLRASFVATTARRTPPPHPRGGLIIFDYEDPTGQWLDPRTSPFSGAELHTFRTVPPSQRLASATLGARAASSRIRAGATTLFTTARDPLAPLGGVDSLGQLVSTAALGVADTPAYTLIIAPGRWRQYVDPSDDDAQILVEKVDTTTDLWRPAFGAGSNPSFVVWRGASEACTIDEVRDLLARGGGDGLAI